MAGLVAAFAVGCAVSPPERTTVLVHTIWFGLGLCYVIGVFAYGFEGRLETAESGFPARLFVLPVRTWVLAARFPLNTRKPRPRDPDSFRVSTCPRRITVENSSLSRAMASAAVNDHGIAPCFLAQGTSPASASEWLLEGESAVAPANRMPIGCRACVYEAGLLPA